MTKLIPTPKSGGETQLKGFDARNRIISSPTGGTRTANILRRPGANVPTEKISTATPTDYFRPNEGPHFRTPAPPRKQK
jgi:hypothetical protein